MKKQVYFSYKYEAESSRYEREIRCLVACLLVALAIAWWAEVQQDSSKVSHARHAYQAGTRLLSR